MIVKRKTFLCEVIGMEGCARPGTGYLCVTDSKCPAETCGQWVLGDIVDLKRKIVEDTTEWSALEVEVEHYEMSQTRNGQRLIAGTSNEPKTVELGPDESKGAKSAVAAAVGSFASEPSGTEAGSSFDSTMDSSAAEDPGSM